MPGAGDRLLRGWKEIAAHLGTSPKTAQRWAQARGLPVYGTGRTHRSVAAYSAELDAWLAEHRRDDGPDVGPEPATGERGPDDARAANSGTSAAGRWVAIVGLAAVVLGIGLWAGSGLWAESTSSWRPWARGRTPGEAGSVGLHFTLPDGRPVDLVVPADGVGVLQVSPSLRLEVDARRMGSHVDLVIFEPGRNRRRHAVASGSLAGPGPDAPVVEFLLTEGALGVAWVR